MCMKHGMATTGAEHCLSCGDSSSGPRWWARQAQACGWLPEIRSPAVLTKPTCSTQFHCITNSSNNTTSERRVRESRTTYIRLLHSQQGDGDRFFLGRQALACRVRKIAVGARGWLSYSTTSNPHHSNTLFFKRGGIIKRSPPNLLTYGLLAYGTGATIVMGSLLNREPREPAKQAQRGSQAQCPCHTWARVPGESQPRAGASTTTT